MHSTTAVILLPTTLDVRAEIKRLFEPYWIGKDAAPHEWCPVPKPHARQTVAKYGLSSLAQLAEAFPQRYRLDAKGYLLKYDEKQDEELCTFNHQWRWDRWAISDDSLSLESFVLEHGQRFGEDFARNMRFVRDLPDDYGCGSIVTPDGDWHDLEDFGWAFLQSDEANHEPIRLWGEFCKETRVRYADHLVVELDVHS